MSERNIIPSLERLPSVAWRVLRTSKARSGRRRRGLERWNGRGRRKPAYVLGFVLSCRVSPVSFFSVKALAELGQAVGRIRDTTFLSSSGGLGKFNFSLPFSTLSCCRMQPLDFRSEWEIVLRRCETSRITTSAKMSFQLRALYFITVSLE